MIRRVQSSPATSTQVSWPPVLYFSTAAHSLTHSPLSYEIQAWVQIGRDRSLSIACHYVISAEVWIKPRPLQYTVTGWYETRNCLADSSFTLSRPVLSWGRQYSNFSDGIMDIMTGCCHDSDRQLIIGGYLQMLQNMIYQFLHQFSQLVWNIWRDYLFPLAEVYSPKYNSFITVLK